jgi:SAM-dependent methyltransferase
VQLAHPEAKVQLEPVADRRTRVTVEPYDPSLYVHRRTCTTSYGVPLLERLLEIKGPAWLCDEILRDEDPAYVAESIRLAVLPYVAEEELDGKRLLDFGCGSGASTAILARVFPHASVVGVELEEELLSIARLRVEHHGLENVELLRSPAGDRLPPGLGSFDFAFLSAVFEHLLPHERGPVLAQVWETVEPGGILFLSETPHRWWPIESHTTGLPLLNYVPAAPALRLARRLSPRVAADASWQDLLRGGIRGGTPREVLALLRAADEGTPRLLRPRRLGLSSAADVWYAKGPPTPVRRTVHRLLQVLDAVTGAGIVPYLSLAIRKDG